jgi:hypothetical protein
MLLGRMIFAGSLMSARLPIFASCRTMKFFRWFETLSEMGMRFFFDIFDILT